MQKVLLKKLRDGHEIPMIGLGTWQQIEESTCIKAIKYALEIGYRHIDTADIYGNHELIKEAIKDFVREKLYITTKLWRDFLDPKKVESECDKALMQLGLDYLDLYLVHWPDRTKPLADISYEMSRLKEKGKVKSIGVSNYTISHLQDLIDQKIEVAVNQVEYHPFLNQEELLKFCTRNSIAITAYCPLARKKIFDDFDIELIAKKYSKKPNQIILRWLIQKDIIAIPKATSENHIKQNIDIFDFELSGIDMEILNNISKTRKKRIINPDFSDFEY